MATLSDVKKSIAEVLSYFPSNINYLKNLLTSINSVSSSTLDNLYFELEVNEIVVDDFISLIMQVHNITSVELPIFFSEPNNQMVEYINKGLGVSSSISEMMMEVYMLIEVYILMSYMEDGSGFDENVSHEMLYPFTGVINDFIQESEKMVELLKRYNNMLR